MGLTFDPLAPSGFVPKGTGGGGPGPEGPKGEFNFTGPWTAKAARAKGDAVTRNGSTWACVKTVTEGEDKEPGTEPAIWKVLAEKGAAGATGEKGEKGEKGTTGEKGETGTPGAGFAPGTQTEPSAIEVDKEIEPSATKATFVTIGYTSTKLEVTQLSVKVGGLVVAEIVYTPKISNEIRHISFIVAAGEKYLLHVISGSIVTARASVRPIS